MGKGLLFFWLVMLMVFPFKKNALCTSSSFCLFAVYIFDLKSIFSFSFDLSGIALGISHKLRKTWHEIVWVAASCL